MSVVNRKAETKCVFREEAKDVPMYHNFVTLLTNNPLYSYLGVRGEDISTTAGNRIGSQIFAKGLKIAIMFENLPKRPNVTYTVALMRNLKDGQVILGNIDTTLQTKNQIFEGRSTIIPMDYIDTSKVQVKWYKTFRVVQRGIGSTITADGEGKVQMEEDGPDDDTGTAEYAGESKAVITPARTIRKFYIPFNKTITYPDLDDGDAESKKPLRPNQWQFVCWAYDNSYTPASVKAADNEVGKVYMTSKFYFTDV